MTAFNAVRFRVKRGRDQEFLDAHRQVASSWPGLRHASIIKSGEGRYCIIAEWEDMESMTAARPQMIATLDGFRDTLEDLGGDIGLTDPVSGPVVLEMK
jgi:quinol monooxygenase YgiN